YYKLNEAPTSDYDGIYVPGVNIDFISNIIVSTDGNHTLYLWLVDEAGNLNYTHYMTTQLYLDTSAPLAPSSLIATPDLWTNIDSFNITWINPSDMSGIVGAYYKLNEVPTSDYDGIYVPGVNIDFISNIIVSTDGNHTLYLWLVDAAGNLNYTHYITTQLYLDTSDPLAPSSLTATPSLWTNLDSFNITWVNPSDMSGIVGAYYKLNEIPGSDDDGNYVAGIDIESISNISVSSDGNHTLYVWLVDKAGNVNYNNYRTVQLYLDEAEPLIIDSQDGDDTWRDSGGTTYNIDFSDGIHSSNLDFAQYRITSESGQEGIVLKDWTNIFTDLGATDYVDDWTIDFTACQEGINYVSVRVYDKAGNLRVLEDVFYVKKDTIYPTITINSPLNNTYWNSSPSINISVLEANLGVLIYTVLGYSPKVLENNTETLLDPDIWDDLPQGAFQVVITSFDILDHESNVILMLYKDTLAPSLSINAPENSTFWNSAPFFNISAFDPNLDTIWYSINNINKTLTNNTLQQLDLSIWSELPGEGEFQVYFYANDTFGHLNDTLTITLFKDIITPNLIINTPYNNTYWNVAPTINVTVIDLYPHTIWYRVLGIKIVLFNNTDQQLNSSIWEILPEEGEFTIYFYANDTVGNIHNISILKLHKDIRNPLITVKNPKPNDLFGDIAPNFEISISETYLNQTWYTLVQGSANYSFIGFTGQINQSLWEEFDNGTVTIIFYANDTLGNLGIVEVTVRKNIYAPIITIVSPGENELYGVISPNFTIYKSGLALNTTWYTIDNGQTNYTFYGLSSTIDQDAWDLFGFANITITFYINDSLGKIGFDVVTVRKDPDPPVISITFIYPGTNNSYCEVEPIFRVSVYEPHLLKIWYRVGTINVEIPNNSDITLNSSIWDNLFQGKFIIEIFAEDLLGYVNDPVNLTYYKDTLAPKLIINNPYNHSYYNSPPPINITVFDPNFDFLIYTVIGYLPGNILLENNTEVLLDQDIWDDLPQGAFFISFTAYDEFGHPNNTLVLTLYKDTIAPTLLINAPTNNTFWNSLPLFNVIAFDPNLDTIWYKFGTTSIELTNNTEEAFDFFLWESISEGVFTVEIFANDTFGQISASVNITLTKDINKPLITAINSPNNNTYYSSPPIMDIIAFDDNLDTLWYIVMGTKIILSSGPEPLDSYIWNNLFQGEFNALIFANDTAGNLNDPVILTLYKDTMAPIIVVNSPQNNTIWNLRPLLNIMAFDPNLDSISYTSLGYIPLPLLNNTDQLFNNLLWIEIEEGMFIIEIFVVDTFGHKNSINLTLYKDTLAPEITINFPYPDGLFGDIAPDFEISVIETYLNTTWYTLIGEMSNITFTGSIGSISQTIWDKFGNGTVTIRFYANDTVGNIGYHDITVRKDIYAPVITISSPGNNEVFGINAPDFIIYKSGPGIQATWYTLDNGLTNFTFTGLSGKINQAVWDNYDDEIIIIRFYVNNSLGKIGYDEVLVRKDPDAPIILVNLPFNQTAFALAPLINLTIIEPNLDTVWYIVDDIKIDLTNNLTQYLDSFIWNNLPQGTFILELFANDTLGNLNNLFQLHLSKDTIGPNITILLPNENQRVDRNSPFFELTLFDENGIYTCWYIIDNGTTPIEFTGTIGRIDQDLWELIWDNKTHGSIITIRFYSRDNLGNIDYQEVMVIKYQPLAPFKILSNPLGFIFSTVGLGVMIPVAIKLTKSRYYENLHTKDKSKLKKVLIAAFLLLSVMVLFYIF
ncbi:MAG: hypothetical protein ACFE9S_17810, partial [Candidatus Hermodarchaeota archaeon]